MTYFVHGSCQINKPGRANRCVRNGSVYNHNVFPTFFGVFQQFGIIVIQQTDAMDEHTDRQTLL